MPERIEIRPEGEPEEHKPARKLSESAARRLLLLRIGAAIIALAALIWLIGFLIGRIALAGATRDAYHRLHQGAAGPGVEGHIRAFGATLSRAQVRVLVAGRSLKHEDLTAHQQRAFDAIRPLAGRRAPTLVPYALRLESIRYAPQSHTEASSAAQWKLSLVWSVRGGGQPVVSEVTLD